MTRFVLLTEFYPPERGGIQASLEPIVAALGDQITVVAPQPAQASARRIVRSLFSGRTWPRWWWLVGWLRQAHRQGAEIVLFGHFSAAVLAGALVQSSGLRYGVLLHGNDVLTEQHRWFVRPFIGWALRRAVFVGVNSSFTARQIQPYRVPAGRILRTHPSVPDQYLIYELAKKQSSFTIISVGRLVPRKNFVAVIQAVKELRLTYPEIKLAILGDGPDREMLLELIQREQLEGCVTLYGEVDEETKWRLLHSANVFVMAPTVRAGGTDVEGLGLVYLEAAAAGLPIVASNTGGVRDAVIDGQTGMIVDPNDTSAIATAVGKLLANPQLAQHMGQAGKALVAREYTVSTRVGRLLTVLRGPVRQPHVSIIIPAYQCADTIGQTLNSVFQQSYHHLEVIIVDDGSTDQIEAAVAPYRSKVTFVHQENAGAPAARNCGFQYSHGDYVVFLDADITLEPQMVMRMVEQLTVHPEASFSYSDFHFGWKHFRLHDFSVESLRQMNYIHTSSLIRRSAFLGFDQSLQRFQDWDLWLSMAEHGQLGVWIPETLFRVQQRRRGLGMSTWLPSFVYRLPFIGRGQGSATVLAYRQAEQVIRAKHRI